MINLTKGESLDLTKDTPSLKRVVAGFGWDTNNGKAIDLDGGAIIVRAGSPEFVFFNHKKSGDDNVHHTGDNLTGDGDGDDEQIKVNLEALGSNVTAIIFTINSYSGEKFGDVKNAFARIVNSENDVELVKFDLTNHELGAEKAVEIARLDREGDGWKFTAVGAGYDKLETILNKYGIN